MLCSMDPPRGLMLAGLLGVVALWAGALAIAF
jgi:hypothetical protein